ncbi:MAG: hypothetical protein ABI534_04815 [Chloroflexota bacterium]
MTIKHTPRAAEWVACRDQVRLARDGRVACPIRGTAVDLESCATCHWLEDADQDRFAAWTCDADNASLTPIPIGGSFPESSSEGPDAALIIELL